MKRTLFFFVMMLSISVTYGQTKSISLSKKLKTPYITIDNDTINIKDFIIIQEGSNEDGGFKYVLKLNSFNEPLGPAGSESAFKKQEIVFFKEQDGTTYLFTKYYIINIEAALKNNEIKILL